MSKHVLVVGGAGYIGSAVTDLLAEAGHEVRVYDCLLWETEYRRVGEKIFPHSAECGNEIKPVEFIRGDIRDRERLKPHLAWADAVIWLAALVADGACAMYPELAVELNNRAVAWFVANYDGRIIFPSTSLAYGIGDAPFTEDAPLRPQTLYQETKVAAERHLAGRALVLRLATLFGLATSDARPRFDLVPNLFTMRACVGDVLTVRGGQQYRGFCHVRDVAQVMADHVGTAIIGPFNLVMENERIIDLTARIQRHVPIARVDVQPADRSATGDVRLDATHARTVLGFQPRHTLDDGIREISELVTSGRLRDARSARYSNEASLKARPLTDAFLKAFPAASTV
ncbi:NAD(P)-dependent oxidoreductase [Candidatus Uhrbacteria bacterium]|nr:NAD(P)-dependent oxidoreductase [Candidatus Uhrbacteria bacterium]